MWEKMNMIGAIKLLVVEDSEDDALLIRSELQLAGYEVISTRVETAEAMSRALDSGTWDLIISDHSLPCFSSAAALRIMKEHRLDIPFIIVSGTIDEETAVGAMKAGAHDFVTKGNMARLAPAVRRELSEAESRGQRRWAERELQKTRDRLQLIIEASPVGIVVLQNGLCVYVNPAVVRMFGFERPEEVLGHPMEQYVAPGSRELAGKTYESLLAGRDLKIPVDVKGIRWGGEEFSLSAWPTRIDYLGEPAVLAFVTDTSEVETLKGQLFQAQKMEALGALAGGIAHDFNNILFAISGFTELARAEAGEGTKMADYLNQVLHATDRASDMVKQILTFSRQNRVEKKPVNLGPIVKEALKLIRASIPPTIEIRQTIEPELPSILADATQFHQVLMNFCTNATHAMDSKPGVLAVDLRAVEIDSDRSLHLPELDSGTYLKLSVSDTGRGMPPEVVDRIFEPYFSTKRPEEGTGLGLSVVHGIVKAHGGSVVVSSEPGKGSAFTVYVPVAEDIRRSEEPSSKEPVPTGCERILYVDDERPLVEVGQQILGSLGYDVTVATGSREALEVFRSAPYGFDLVITDLMMPHMTGLELAQKLTEIRPDLPIVCCTGFAQRATGDEAKRSGIRAVVMKPVLKRDIARTVRQALDG